MFQLRCIILDKTGCRVNMWSGGDLISGLWNKDIVITSEILTTKCDLTTKYGLTTHICSWYTHSSLWRIGTVPKERDKLSLGQNHLFGLAVFPTPLHRSNRLHQSCKEENGKWSVFIAVGNFSLSFLNSCGAPLFRYWHFWHDDWRFVSTRV